jgi:hypothetical protein
MTGGGYQTRGRGGATKQGGGATKQKAITTRLSTFHSKILPQITRNRSQFHRFFCLELKVLTNEKRGIIRQASLKLHSIAEIFEQIGVGPIL